MLGTETGEQAVVMFLIFGFEDREVAAKAVTKIVQTRCSFAGFGFGTGGMEKLAWLAATCAGVDIEKTPLKMKSAERDEHPDRREEFWEGERLPKIRLTPPTKRFALNWRVINNICVVTENLGRSANRGFAFSCSIE